MNYTTELHGMNSKTNNMAAFTLVEVSIVLIVIGLIIGGILVGSDLIRAAAIRATISQIQSYETAALTFKNKYNCLPGDCINPSDFGLSGGCSSIGAACGNGTIGGKTQLGFITAEYRIRESFDFWLQLSEAQLIEGKYAGATAAIAADNASPGYAFPATKLNNKVGILVSALASNLGGPNFFRTNTGSTIVGSGDPKDLFLPIDNFQLDSKMDDGYPDSGKVMLVTVYDGAQMPNSDYEVLAKDDSLGHSYGPEGATSQFCATDEIPSQYNVANTKPYYNYPGRPETPNCSIAIKVL
ncbi:MAG: hypothetical protein LW823_01695 [Rickettsiales bacterium]|jgi:type II secretory pathway pseudopilin PulG|nr:hypothetical protein [Rickettsiales bacterium]